MVSPTLKPKARGGSVGAGGVGAGVEAGAEAGHLSGATISSVSVGAGALGWQP